MYFKFESMLHRGAILGLTPNSAVFFHLRLAQVKNWCFVQVMVRTSQYLRICGLNNPLIGRVRLTSVESGSYVSYKLDLPN